MPSDSHAALKLARTMIDTKRYDEALVTLNNFCAEKRSHYKACSKMPQAVAMVDEVQRHLHWAHAMPAPAESYALKSPASPRRYTPPRWTLPVQPAPKPPAEPRNAFESR